MLFERAKLMQLLYHSLPNRKKHVLPGKKVVAVEQDDYGVEVACTDGSKYSGDILVGCDGAHSIARRLGMPGAPTAQPFESKFRCLFGVAKLVDGLEPCSLIETHDKDVMFQLLTSETQAFFLVYEAKGPEEADYKRYTQADCEALARKYGAHAIGRGGRAIFSHLWETRDRADLFDLGEGIADKWHGGRVVLLGDAVHKVSVLAKRCFLNPTGKGGIVADNSALKMTSNHAFGANCALEDAASLTNGLRALIQRNGSPSALHYGDVFGQYQKERQGRAKLCMLFTGNYTRFATWQNWFYKFACLYLAPAIGDQFVADWCFSLIPKHGVKLDFVPEGQSKVGKVMYSM